MSEFSASHFVKLRGGGKGMIDRDGEEDCLVYQSNK